MGVEAASILKFSQSCSTRHIKQLYHLIPSYPLDKTPIWEAEEQATDQAVRWICAIPATAYETFEQKDSKQEGVQFWTSFVRTPRQVLLPLPVHLMWVSRWIRQKKKKDIRISF